MKRRNFLKYTGAAGIATTLPVNQLSATSIDRQKGFIIEEEREIPIKGEFDVVVCGGGPAGIAAAIEAGRSGAKTMLIENNGCLGGVWTSGSLTWILDYHHQKGILKEITEELTKRGAECPIETGNGSFAFDLESMKILLDELVLDAGVKIRFHTRVCNVLAENGRLTHVVSESKSGREVWNAKLFIDATGDGDLAALAGCGFDFGDPENTGATQPFSLLGIITGVEFDEIKDYARWVGDTGQMSKKNLLAAIQKGGYEPSYRKPSIHPISYNLFKIMSNHEYGFSAIDSDDVTEATLIGRNELHKVINALKNNGGIWKNIRLISSAEQIGTREGRRIHGLYTVSTEDLRKGIFHDDAIAEVRFGVDVHSVKKAEDSKTNSYSRGIKSKPYTIPLRSLIAKDIDGLLLAGRCISGDFIAHSSYRVTGPVTTIGQAAGRAAAVSSKMKKLPQEIDFKDFGFEEF